MCERKSNVKCGDVACKKFRKKSNEAAAGRPFLNDEEWFGLYEVNCL